MLIPHLYILVFVLIRSIHFASSTKFRPRIYREGCIGNAKPRSKGLSMELYEYPYLNPIVECSDGTLNCREYSKDALGTDACINDNFKFANYPRYGFKEQKLIARVDGVASEPGQAGSLDFDITADSSCVPQLNSLPIAYNYKPEIHTTNFSMLLYGYFKPQITGVHIFTMVGDTEALMNIGVDTTAPRPHSTQTIFVYCGEWLFVFILFNIYEYFYFIVCSLYRIILHFETVFFFIYPLADVPYRVLLQIIDECVDIIMY
ncbi:uncharacterized protein RNJ42_01171 [Nakaseomyces bracarensis]|uniref:uncharacterized protein n=1 Tax=Nakaseomyces bracarensis TaxID=273131 RepID=UPI003871BEC6